MKWAPSETHIILINELSSRRKWGTAFSAHLSRNKKAMLLMACTTSVLVKRQAGEVGCADWTEIHISGYWRARNVGKAGTHDILMANVQNLCAFI